MLTSIEIKNYRNIKNIKAELDPKISLIIAPNGSGKTNFIEAVYYSVFGESFRPVNSIEELIGPNEEYLRITMEWFGDVLEFVINPQKLRKFSINGKKAPLAKIPHKFPAILFAPQSVDLVAREPGIRRQDLDNFISTLNLRYRENLHSYKQVLKNRNALIKIIRDGRSKRDELIFWTDKLVSLGGEIYRTRLEFFKAINIQLKETILNLDEFVQDDIYRSLETIYLPNLPPSEDETFEDILSQKFFDNMEKEIIVGKTLYGVHKDDFQINLNNKNLRFLGSRGQQRIGVLLFKLAQSALYEKSYEKKPLLLLDDLMSELDNTNREKLSKILLNTNQQMILSSADEREVPESLKNNGKLINILF